MSVAINSFVKRQTPESPYTHFEGCEEELVGLVEKTLDEGNVTQGYRDGVLLVNVPCDKFHTGLVELCEGDQLVGEFKSRREGETPRKSSQVDRGESIKQPAKAVQVVLYRHDVLAESDEAETDATWEIISLNGYPTEEVAPIDPMTLMHNHFGSDGGTDTNLSAEEFEQKMRESFDYWKNKALLK